MNWIAERREGLAIALDAVRANKLRSALTTLGIIIGIATVTLMGTAIESLDSAFRKSISVIGADKLFVSRNAWFVDSEVEWKKIQRRPSITEDQAKSFMSQLTHVRGVAPRVETFQTVRYRCLCQRHDGSIPANQWLFIGAGTIHVPG